jgi:hypothetical protein
VVDLDLELVAELPALADRVRAHLRAQLRNKECAPQR